MTLEELRLKLTKAGSAHFDAWLRHEEARIQLMNAARAYYDAKAEAEKKEEVK